MSTARSVPVPDGSGAPLLAHEPIGETNATLQPLREDIELKRGMECRDGSQSWVVHDPAGFRHFNIGWHEFEILSRWALGSPALIIERVNRETTLNIGEDEITALENFLRHNGLLRLSASEMIELREKFSRKGAGKLAGLVSTEIVFKKLPLFRPQKMLEKLVPMTDFIFTQTFWLALLIVLATSLYLVGRDWSAFTHGLASMASLEGVVAFAFAMIIAKSFHELAHGITTVRYGGLVPTMGVAFIVFWPLLYTETSAAWQINDRRKRIIIASAGILAELILASIALAIWPYLNDGPIRDTLAFTSTTLIIMTIAFNANPLMKFDGYFVLSELTRFDNLQPRALALLSRDIKAFLIAIDLPEPEYGLKSNGQRWLLAYGVSSAVYRLFLFTGIALALYLFLPPVISIPLALAVILSGLILPLQSFLIGLIKTGWLKGRWRGLSRSMILLAGLITAIFIPLETSIQVPVIYASGRVHQLFSPEPGRVLSLEIEEGQAVVTGHELLKLTAPENGIELKWARERSRIFTHLMDRSLTSNALRQEYHIRKNELSELEAQITGLRELNQALQLRAPHSGRITNIIDGLENGVWVQSQNPLIEIVTKDHTHITAYVSERDLDLMSVTAEGTFWLAGRPTQNWAIAVNHIEAEPIPRLDEPYLAERLGGSIRVRIEDNGELTAKEGVYKVRLTLLESEVSSKLPDIKTMGFAKIETPPRSLFTRLSIGFMAVWHREFG